MRNIFFRTILAAFAAVTMVAFAGCGKDGSNSSTYNGGISSGNGNGIVNPIPHPTPGPGPEPQSMWVDLGLPSGKLWATCNIGANTPEEYGDYFAWGETSTKSDYSWSTYAYGSDEDQLTKYCSDSYCGLNGFTDYLTTLQSGDDAATARLGNGARTPTKNEWDELLNKTTAEWTTQNGVYGIRFTANNGKSIFLPAAGHYDGTVLRNTGDEVCYWSASLQADYPANAYGFIQYSILPSSGMAGYHRKYGLSVRAVRPR